MKYIVVVGDGMADYPRPELDNKTPLQYAVTPNMDLLAAQGKTGMVKTVPNGFPPGSDVANLSVMGYAPEKYYTGRSPLEAVSMGVELAEQDVAFRCNLITLSDDAGYEQKTMVDYSAGEITSEEAAELIAAVNQELGGSERRFYPGISYRHLMVWQGGPVKVELTPPHDISDRSVTDYLPKGEGQDILLEIMRNSYLLLKDHPVNRSRIQRGLRPANSVWLWGQGKKPSLPLFKELYGLQGAVISAVDLIMGIGICAGLEIIKVPGATGNIHTNFLGKAEVALTALRDGADFIYLHVEAPDEAGHQGETETKVKAIEEIDRLVLATLLKSLPEFGDYKIMLLPDHPTPLSIKTHTAEPVPFALMDSRGKGASGRTYDEQTAAASGIMVANGPALMKSFIA
ncbi:phosphoglycerate mutase [Desulfotomaculum arcticum]|uniref:Phosphoglycerate mutase n=1 Tax=Desulfotruncus arcticus DSM 17038 TaxID=1121424 RepID=A0A1I2N183_9FIRM|nr:cofactor-independent phosphoglycerate mutase [Desulfotruncus arcticus]SFF95131.1 phosphoglycerate mutase [Desulfotomaculum arcticum] [Desulfotruncus arcticus DSM 17038]